MDTTTALSTQSASTAVASTSTTANPSSVISSDFETFLQMMTTQARYQDPLDPIDNAEYASQLAQFSMVEQQVRTNETLALLSTAFGASGPASLSGWIGMDALSSAPVAFNGAPITIAPTPNAEADKSVLIVTNETGQPVSRQSIPVTAQGYEWAGHGSDGELLPHGRYVLSIETYKGEELLSSGPAQSYSQVSEARVQDGKTVLILDSGAQIATDGVTGLRAPRENG